MSSSCVLLPVFARFPAHLCLVCSLPCSRCLVSQSAACLVLFLPEFLVSSTVRFDPDTSFISFNRYYLVIHYLFFCIHLPPLHNTSNVTNLCIFCPQKHKVVVLEVQNNQVSYSTPLKERNKTRRISKPLIRLQILPSLLFTLFISLSISFYYF